MTPSTLAHLSRFGLLLLVMTGCEPIATLPGGKLSGTVTPPPDDWSFTEAVETIQLETRPSDPYSVNVWCMVVNDRLAVATRSESAWVGHIEENSNVRVRIGENLYELAAVRIDDPGDVKAVFGAMERKYERVPASPEERASGIAFALVPRSRP